MASKEKWHVGNQIGGSGGTYNPAYVNDENGRSVARMYGFPDGFRKLEEINRKVYGESIRRAFMVAKAPEMARVIEELCDCLEDVARGKGGWAWEDVIGEGRSVLRQIETGGLDS